MVRVRYVGVANIETALRDLEPARSKLIDIARHYRPFGSDYMVLHAAVRALDTAAYHFTGNAEFYGLGRAPSRPPE